MRFLTIVNQEVVREIPPVFQVSDSVLHNGAHRKHGCSRTR